jgi:hypothetical protein
MGGIPESMQLVKTRRLILFCPFYNKKKQQVPRGKEKQNGKQQIYALSKKLHRKIN